MVESRLSSLAFEAMRRSEGGAGFVGRPWTPSSTVRRGGSASPRPVELVDGSATVRLPHAQRTLLAALAARPFGISRVRLGRSGCCSCGVGGVPDCDCGDGDAAERKVDRCDPKASAGAGGSDQQQTRRYRRPFVAQDEAGDEGACKQADGDAPQNLAAVRQMVIPTAPRARRALSARFLDEGLNVEPPWVWGRRFPRRGSSELVSAVWVGYANRLTPAGAGQEPFSVTENSIWMPSGSRNTTTGPNGVSTVGA
jgi:hypothetical protein